jgi:aminoglycoside 6'-N-acetyltransferase I
VGLAELSIRPCAEGRRTSRVAYLEGWFVAPEARRQGVGRALLKAAEEWGRTQGCTEFASDTQPDNVISTTAHHALGFAEVGLVRCFRKEI